MYSTCTFTQQIAYILYVYMVESTANSLAEIYTSQDQATATCTYTCTVHVLRQGFVYWWMKGSFSNTMYIVYTSLLSAKNLMYMYQSTYSPAEGHSWPRELWFSIYSCTVHVQCTHFAPPFSRNFFVDCLGFSVIYMYMYSNYT